ncbi:cobalt-precorrin 5A hydrolase [Desulfopila inferna]|uniref:cobalt-precorrin 5A hydrolase n=1 Tax=Desulfopila inferna TaxID=468528 RepID=UPI001964B49E|nr:cobalamin biosynthesis protein [Desulfopila inferna]MBM9603676.1 cobalamin biosynthesis protein [Desulfopila inferna]
MKIAVLALTRGGKKLAGAIADDLPGCRVLSSNYGVGAALKTNWQAYDAFVCIMATGIVVRSIAGLLRDKHSDPAVIVLDEKGDHVISLLSGHLGGGNTLARRIAGITGGTAVITTASDTLGLVPLDLWAAEQKLRAADEGVFTAAAGMLVNNGSLRVFCDVDLAQLPPGLCLVKAISEADLVISHRLPPRGTLSLHPHNLVVGVGCNRNTPVHEFEEALAGLFEDLGFSTLSVRNLATIDVKNDEEGLLLFARKNGWSIDFFDRDTINTITNVSRSDAALKAVGAIGVAEPASLLSADTNTLLSRKRKWRNITMAVARADFMLSAQVLDHLNT